MAHAITQEMVLFNSAKQLAQRPPSKMKGHPRFGVIKTIQLGDPIMVICIGLGP